MDFAAPVAQAPTRVIETGEQTLILIFFDMLGMHGLDMLLEMRAQWRESSRALSTALCASAACSSPACRQGN
jgi:hypothetical protein